MLQAILSLVCSTQIALDAFSIMYLPLFGASLSFYVNLSLSPIVVSFWAKANPSQAEAIYKDFKAKKAKLVTKKKVDVSERYGNAAAADKPDDELLLGQTEAYREYDASGGQLLLYLLLLFLLHLLFLLIPSSAVLLGLLLIVFVHCSCNICWICFCTPVCTSHAYCSTQSSSSCSSLYQPSDPCKALIGSQAQI